MRNFHAHHQNSILLNGSARSFLINPVLVPLRGVFPSRGVAGGSGMYHLYIAPDDVHTILMDVDFHQATSGSVNRVDRIDSMLNEKIGLADVECTDDCGAPMGAEGTPVPARAVGAGSKLNGFCTQN
jgi:hypothetical protein